MPKLFETTKKAEFDKRDDFFKVRLSRTSKNVPNFIKISNPHKQNSGTWISFESFRNRMIRLKATGKWPNGTVFSKNEIDIQFVLYARKIRKYNPLNDDYYDVMTLDVEEAAVYCGPKSTE